MNTGPFLIMFAAGLWAVDALIRTPLTKDMPAATIVFWEHLIGFCLLFPFWYRSRTLFAKLTKIDWIYIVALTLLSSIGGTILFTLALGKSFATGDFVTPLLLQKTQPLIVILLSALFLKEKITKRYLFFAPLAVFGSYVMSFGLAAPNFTFGGKELVYILSLGAAAAWGGGTILSKKILVKLTFVESVIIRFLMAIPFAYITAVLLGQTPKLEALSTDALVRFLAIGLTTGAGALLIYYRGLAKTKASVSTISELMFPFVSILIAVTPLNPYGAPQALSTPNIFGIVLLLVSVLVISFDYAKETAVIILSGPVIKGSGDGRKIGFPTANIRVSQTPPMPYGVYACRIAAEKKAYSGILHYGPRIIFGETNPQVEVFLFQFHKTIYGKTVRVTVGKNIRASQNFPTVAAMKKQIEKDIQKAKEFAKTGS